MNAIIVSQFISSFLYFAISIFSLIGTILYFNAFILMKKTRIIGATTFLLFTIFIDSLWWGIVEFGRFMSPDHIYSAGMTAPIPIIVIKLLLLSGIFGFVIISIIIQKK